MLLKALSFSININSLGELSKIDFVSPPGPGPISITVKPSTGNMFLTILFKTLKSKIKFCPNLFLGKILYSLIISLSFTFPVI